MVLWEYFIGGFGLDTKGWGSFLKKWWMNWKEGGVNKVKRNCWEGGGRVGGLGREVYRFRII